MPDPATADCSRYPRLSSPASPSAGSQPLLSNRLSPLPHYQLCQSKRRFGGPLKHTSYSCSSTRGPSLRITTSSLDTHRHHKRFRSTNVVDPQHPSLYAKLLNDVTGRRPFYLDPVLKEAPEPVDAHVVMVLGRRGVQHDPSRR